jgi:hypothetical protein
VLILLMNAWRTAIFWMPSGRLKRQKSRFVKQY